MLFARIKMNEGFKIIPFHNYEYAVMCENILSPYIAFSMIDYYEADKFCVTNRETGDIIEKVATIGEALKVIEKFEREDEENNTFEADFYDITNEWRESIYHFFTDDEIEEWKDF